MLRVRQDRQSRRSASRARALPNLRAEAAIHVLIVPAPRTEGARVDIRRPDLRRVLPPPEGRAMHRMRSHIALCPKAPGYQNLPVLVLLAAIADRLHSMRRIEDYQAMSRRPAGMRDLPRRGQTRASLRRVRV